MTRRRPARSSGPAEDLWADESVELRRVQPYQATKTYVCPGCNGTIPPGTGHLAVVPIGAVDLRRHWHHACWSNRRTRPPHRPR